MLRQPQAGMPQPLLTIAGPPFLNNNPQPGPPNSNPMPNPNMRFAQQPGFIPGRPGGMSMRPGQNQPPMNANVNHPGGQQMQGINFSGNMMPQGGGGPAVRRVASQPQMNPGGMGGHMPGMQQGPMNMGGMPQAGIPNSLRNPQQQNQLRPQLTGPAGADMGGGLSGGGMPNSSFQNISGPHPAMNHNMGPGPPQPMRRSTPDMFNNFGEVHFPRVPVLDQAV
ncbi:hypothetical protein D9757_005298 [Collybiopsis confluens]|uniref:Uncharacterized protein n=1 Tax=Collybiopsis confluens TaxID=2823264 RepID=A0A8H5MDZ9_9AGAR|nr:hypothetical protein D9757_005298 [Collybiopsis confluens]